jgi:hypothetical protein
MMRDDMYSISCGPKFTPPQPTGEPKNIKQKRLKINLKRKNNPLYKIEKISSKKKKE